MADADDIGTRLAELAGAGQLVAYFGYGSLVNRATHRTAIIHAVPARLAGWRRLWRARPDLIDVDTSLLTVRPQPGSILDGLLVFDRAEHLPALDEREEGYDRRSVVLGDLTVGIDVPQGCPVYVYEAGPAPMPGDRALPILQSYLDAVLQGFLVEHGREGVERFVSETEAFDTPVLDDRAAPQYPRHVRLTTDERRFFDGLLDARGVTRIDRSA